MATIRCLDLMHSDAQSVNLIARQWHPDRLMIRYGVVVRAGTTYVIKGVDEDYFADLNAG